MNNLSLWPELSKLVHGLLRIRQASTRGFAWFFLAKCKGISQPLQFPHIQEHGKQSRHGEDIANHRDFRRQFPRDKYEREHSCRQGKNHLAQEQHDVSEGGIGHLREYRSSPVADPISDLNQCDAQKPPNSWGLARRIGRRISQNLPIHRQSLPIEDDRPDGFHRE